jgi:uncharacterized protein YrrD
MRRANQVIGVPVLTADSSRQLGTVKDIAYAPDRGRVVGFILDDADHDSLPFEAVTDFSADTILVRDPSVIVDHDNAPDINRALESGFQINGTTVGDADGNDIGEIDDTFFDERTGQITGFQIHVDHPDRVGMTGDDTEERKLFLPVDRITNWDEDQVRVGYMGRGADMTNERWPEGYDRRDDTNRRRVA